MSFFSKIKQNLNHGGVKISMDAPGSVSTIKDAFLPVTVTLVAGSEDRIINSIKIALEREPNMSNKSEQQMRKMVTDTIFDEKPFTLKANETKTMELKMVMNAGSAMADTITEKTGSPAVAKALEGLSALITNSDHDDYDYYVTATADVEGISLDPSCQRSISMNGPGQFGTSIKL